jgi:hypothetical protein
MWENMMNYIWRLFGFSEENVNLYERMSGYIKHNNVVFKKYNGYIITIKSVDVLKKLNTVKRFDNKVLELEAHNELLKQACIELLKEIQPTLIYSFNNEIHLVFNDSNYLYNGNITKKLSKCVSLSTIALSKAFNRSIVCTGYAVEFYKNHEILNYLIWRQYDCKRNTLNLLYKCKNPDKEIPKLSVIENDIEINKKIIYGIFVKQKLVTINDKKQKEYLRNTIVIEEDGELLFDKDFDNNLENLINSKYIL